METANIMAALADTQNDFLPLRATDHIEFYVGNAKQAAYYYINAFGFKSLAYAGPETGTMDKVSYAIRQNKLTFVLTTSVRTGDAIADHVYKHGDGVKVIALTVDDCQKAWQETTSRGGISTMAPQVVADGFGQVTICGIQTFGQTVHHFIERAGYSGAFLPGFVAWQSKYSAPSTGLLYVDHCVGNVGWNQMNVWVDFYEKVMGFKNILTFDDTDISTEYSALMSKVMSSGDGFIKFPINEPAAGKKKSQVEEYLEFYQGEGVQHIAIATKNIVATVGELQRRGVEFLNIPDSYYKTVMERVGVIDEDIAELQRLGVLIDRDEEGYLLQIFSKPLQDRPTLFFEIIERKGAQSFGKGNFKALFEALEREQDMRGNL